MSRPESRVPLGKAAVLTHPSLALTKYWGKLDVQRNIPATPSLAVGLKELTCKTSVEVFAQDRGFSGPHPDQVSINGTRQAPERFESFFSALRRLALAEGFRRHFTVQARSETNFPVAAGIASSSAGFAALALACVHALSLKLSGERISALARVGSASAARAVFGGFTFLPAGGEHAAEVFGASFWPTLRVIVVETEQGKKDTSSRLAMEQCRLTSPFYEAWLSDARVTAAEAMEALRARDLERLGPLIRCSYMRMFATMFAARPPIRYWSSKSLQVLNLTDKLRQEGCQLWETMDAGPQVKIFCEEEDVRLFIARLGESVPKVNARVCTVAPSPQVQNL